MAKITTTKALSTKVLSARVTPDVYDAWQSLANSTNKSVSECLRDAVTMVDKEAVVKGQDGLSVPQDLNRALGAIGGGTVVGILAYKGLKATFLATKSHNLTEDQIEAISIVLGLSAGIFVGAGIHHALDR